VGFAIPSTLAAEIMARLMEDGVVERSWLGVSIQPFTPAIARAFNSEGVAGVLVSGVQKGSPASNAGVRAGDVVLSFGAERVESPSQLRHVVALSTAGVAAKLEVLRDGRRKLMSVVLQRKTAKLNELKENNNSGPASLQGLRLEDLRFVDGRERRQLGVEADVLDGVLIRSVAPGSAASRAGLRAGDVIVEVNRNEISTMKELQKQVSASSEALITRILRGKSSLYVLLS
jgi:S1-C subfamily serine protease